MPARHRRPTRALAAVVRPGAARRAVLAGAAALVLGADVVALAATGGAGATPAADSRAAAPASTSYRVAEPAPAASLAPVAAPVHWAWVRPAVVNVWLHPASPSRLDRMTTGPRPAMRAWVHALSVPARLRLADGLMTQALHGDRVAVLSTRRGWSLVRVESQTGAAFRHGIIGYVPDAQLSHTPLPSTIRVGRRAPATVLAAARRYLGVSYLWAGMSRYGIDCSGLTYLALRAAGVTIPRDAADQAAVGVPVGNRELRPGDLVFFGHGPRSAIHHVGIYAGHGLVLHAPHTGSTVRYTKLTAFSDYWGARRVV